MSDKLKPPDFFSPRERMSDFLFGVFAGVFFVSLPLIALYIAYLLSMPND